MKTFSILLSAIWVMTSIVIACIFASYPSAEWAQGCFAAIVLGAFVSCILMLSTTAAAVRVHRAGRL